MKKTFLAAFLLTLAVAPLSAQIVPDLETAFASFPVPEDEQLFYTTLNHSIFQHPEINEIKEYRDIIQHTYLYWLGLPDTFDDRLISYTRGVFGRKSTNEVIVFEIISPAETIAKLLNSGIISETGKMLNDDEVYLFPYEKSTKRTINYYLVIAGHDQIFMANSSDMLKKMVLVRDGKLPSAIKDKRFAPFFSAASKSCFDYTITNHTMIIEKQLRDVLEKAEKNATDQRAITGMKEMINAGPQVTFEFTAYQNGQYTYKRHESYGSEEYAARFLSINNSRAERIREIQGHRDYWDLRAAKTLWTQKGKLVAGRLVFDQLLIDKARDWWTDKMEEDQELEDSFTK